MVERRDLPEDLLKRLTELETTERDGKEDRDQSHVSQPWPILNSFIGRKVSLCYRKKDFHSIVIELLLSAFLFLSRILSLLTPLPPFLFPPALLGPLGPFFFFTVDFFFAGAVERERRDDGKESKQSEREDLLSRDGVY